MTAPNSQQSAAVSELPHSAQFDASPSDFNAVTWTNSVLSSSPPSSISLLLDLLQDHIRDSHIGLDTSLKTALSAVPWVVRETDKVRQRANLLRAGVDGVGLRVEGVETGVASSVTTIADADTVVRRVQRATELLSQAVDAERLLSRLDALLSSSAADGSDLVSAADVVSQLRATLAPLKPIAELADRFKQLDEADRKLEALAAPQLKKALEERNTQAASNARIVFDHAGRDNAFQTQYVALRSDQVRKLWTTAWEAKEAAISEEEKAMFSGTPGDLADVGAEVILVAFYSSLFEMMRTEAEWLRTTFPDLHQELVPSLICEAVGNLRNPLPVSNVFLSSSAPDSLERIDSTASRLFDIAHTSVTGSARITKLLVSEDFAEKLQDLGTSKARALTDAIIKALSALLSPFRSFWNSTTQVTIRRARTGVLTMELPETETSSTASSTTPQKFRPSYTEVAKDIERCSATVLTALESLLTRLNQQTCGAGIGPMKQASTTIASVLSDRLLAMLRLPASPSVSAEDEWTTVGGALRLLIASSALKRAWESRKESLYAVAIGTATPILEVASAVRENPVERIEQFLRQSESENPIEAAVVWELVRDEKLATRIVTDFESLDSARDYEEMMEFVHHIVYDTMFAGVKSRFASFNSRELWNSESTDGEVSMLGFSSSPLAYATEVSDYLMTIPQQLEPFVPDDEDAKYATPRSLASFSSNYHWSQYSSAKSERPQRTGEELSGEGDVENMSFAGVWISTLAIGTMELYVEKISTIQGVNEAGAKQLATDADYICNVIASLGVAPTAEMTLALRLLSCNADATSVKEIASDFTSTQHRKLIRKLSALRGINVTV